MDGLRLGLRLRSGGLCVLKKCSEPSLRTLAGDVDTGRRHCKPLSCREGSSALLVCAWAVISSGAQYTVQLLVCGTESDKGLGDNTCT